MTRTDGAPGAQPLTASGALAAVIGDRFLWGVSTSAFQVEGSPLADWTTWRLRGPRDARARRQGVAHDEHLDEDIRLVGELGVGAYRFSVEWSRVCPTPGSWDDHEVERYRHLAHRLRRAGIEPVCTLHHFTAPAWLARRADWTDRGYLEEFLGFAKRMVRALSPDVRLWVTVNEPNVLAVAGYLSNWFPPGARSGRRARQALANLLLAHSACYDLIHALSPGPVAVGLAHNMVVFAPAYDNPVDHLLTRAADQVFNRALLEAAQTGRLRLGPRSLDPAIDVGLAGRLDFLGVNYYFRLHAQLPRESPWIPFRMKDRSGRGLTDLGWEVYPEGLVSSLETAASAGVPLLVTENGAAARDDGQKIAYLAAHLDSLARARRVGSDVRGYFWWSLMDNYEWLAGLGARFGLYHVDLDTLDRSPTAAAPYYREYIARHPAGP